MTEQRGSTFFVKGEKIVLKRDGTWFADGVEITHEQTRDLFFKAIRWDAEAKQYCLSVGYETIHIEVEDTPYFVTAVKQAKGKFTVTLSNFTDVAVKADCLTYENGMLYLALDDGQRAKFLSAPYYELLKNLEEDETAYYLTISGKRKELSRKPALTKGSGGRKPRRGGPKHS